MKARSIVQSALLGSCLFALVTPALAQQSPAPAQPADNGSVAQTPIAAESAPDAAADIVVTGSRIRGAAPVGSNVISIGSDQISVAPGTTVTDFLRKVPQIQGFGVDASSPTVTGGQGGTNTTRGSAINLRGVGPQATLNLVDGQRLSFSGVVSNYVDASVIPTIAIDRVEVVADGASAVYGSDAVAGVVNFILKKDFEGLQFRGRYGFADNYWLAQWGAIAGHKWDTGREVVAGEISHHSNLNGGDRNFVRSDLRSFGGNNYQNGQCNPGNIIIGSTTYPIPVAGVTKSTAGTLVPGAANTCENLRYADIVPSEKRESAYLSLRQDIGNHLHAHLESFYTDRTYTSLAVQQGSTSNIANLTVPNTNYYYVLPTGSTATSETVQYDFTRELGLIRQQGYTRSLFLTGGLTWDVAPKWHVSLDGVYSSDASQQITKRVNTTVLATALRSNDPATAFNPYGTGNSASVLESIYSGLFNPYNLSRTRGASIEADGSLLTLPGGDVRLATGAEFVRYTSDAGLRSGLYTAPTNAPTPPLSRNQKSVYAEFLVPIFGAGNSIGGIRRLDLSAAVRYDDYNDVGHTTNPKIGLNWSPVSGVLLKGSYGTSFRAPGLQDLLLQRAGAGLIVSTWTDPTSSTGTSTGLVLNAGNPNLKPETAKTWSGTVELTPPSVPGLRLSGTYFSINYRGLIAYPPQTTSSLLDPNYASLVVRNPSAALIQSYVAQGLPITGVLPATVAFLYGGAAANLGSVVTRGIDFDASYSFDLGPGKLNIGANGSYVLSYKFAVTAAATPVQDVGYINYPVRFRGRGFLGYRMQGFSVDATLNHVSGYRNNLVTPVQRVSSWNTVDATIGYEFPDSSSLHGVAVGIDVNNLFDRKPPFVNIQGGWDAGQASALGRLLSFSVSKKF